jgi:hypothetical protein
MNQTQAINSMLTLQATRNLHLEKETFARQRGSRLLCLLVLSASLAVGCEQMRKDTYPGDFVYLEQNKVSGEMALLSSYMTQLDEIMLDDATVSSEQQQQILAVLSNIDTSANRLGSGNVRTNHLLIDSHIDQFKLDVDTAIRDARADPPNYFALGRLSGSCAGCHKYR